MRRLRNPHPTRAQVRQLLEHAPRIFARESPVIDWENNGVRYAGWWWAFIEMANQDHFLNWDDEIEAARALLDDRERLACASFDEWSDAFTLFLRAERFCDGYWNGAVETGEAAALLSRLEQLERDWADA
jgi:Family of unknown function (DUF6508)